MEERIFRAPHVRKSTEAQLAARKRYATRHPDRIKTWRLAGSEKLKAYNKQKRENLRIETFTRYGPNGILKCSWDGCFVSDMDMLVLDHVDDNGAEERKALGGKNAKGWNFYQYLKSLGFPEGYQTLCCNHNHKKELLRIRNKTTASLRSC